MDPIALSDLPGDCSLKTFLALQDEIGYIVRKKVRLIHWNREEGGERAKLLRGLGYSVLFEIPSGQSFFRTLRQNPPDAVVVDLSRLPSQGRDMGLAVRHFKETCKVPIVFAGGEPEKRKRILERIPDAVPADWDGIAKALRKAIAHPPESPARPRSLLEGYEGAPLVKKLGIKKGMRVNLVNAPEGFESSLGALPEGAVLSRSTSGKRGLTLWFAASRKDFEGRLEKIAALAEPGPLWIAWKKRGSGSGSGLTQQHVRETGLAIGWVDYKICKIDDLWAGLLFTKRKQ
jgi:hypothetical protein